LEPALSIELPEGTPQQAIRTVTEQAKIELPDGTKASVDSASAASALEGEN
jgi:hypothetical protein